MVALIRMDCKYSRIWYLKILDLYFQYWIIEQKLYKKTWPLLKWILFNVKLIILPLKNFQIQSFVSF